MGKPAKIPVSVFAARPVISKAKLSPDGKCVAFTTMQGGVQKGIVADSIDPKRLFAFTGDEKREFNLVAWAGSAANPGALFLFDIGSRRPERLNEMRPGLAPDLLAQPKAVSNKARDGVMIRAYLTLQRGRVP